MNNWQQSRIRDKLGQLHKLFFSTPFHLLLDLLKDEKKLQHVSCLIDVNLTSQQPSQDEDDHYILKKLVKNHKTSFRRN